MLFALQQIHPNQLIELIGSCECHPGRIEIRPAVLYTGRQLVSGGAAAK
jgi:hypothetical protein